MEREQMAVNNFLESAQELATELLRKGDMTTNEREFFSTFTISSLGMFINKPNADALYNTLKSAQQLSIEYMKKGKNTDIEAKFIFSIVGISLTILTMKKDCSKCPNKEKCEELQCKTEKH